jgi:hypothetical protein
VTPLSLMRLLFENKCTIKRGEVVGEGGGYLDAKFRKSFAHLGNETKAHGLYVFSAKNLQILQISSWERVRVISLKEQPNQKTICTIKYLFSPRTVKITVFVTFDKSL